MARDEHPLLGPAERALAKQLSARVPVRGKGYCDSPEDNLVATVTRDVWDAAKSDIAKGKGTELESKFLAAYSSSALAVNAFAPLRRRVALPADLVVEGEMHFEQERSAWAPGYWPTLDVIVERDGAPVRLFVESKCIEFLRKGATGFSAAFRRKASEHLDPVAAAVFETVFGNRNAYDPLDAPQLLKHFLAAKRVAVEQRCEVVLLCVWWEPTDAETHPVFAAHAAAAAELAAALRDPDVTVLPLSYPQLWAHWHAVGDRGLQRHVFHLRERYGVRLAR
jgi:hypothetical protein